MLLYPPATSTTPIPYHGPPTLLPIPSDDKSGGSGGGGGGGGGSVVVTPTPEEKPPPSKHETDFDPKWNVDDEQAKKPKLRPDTPPMVKDKAMPATMVLVIGIILGAFVAMVMIVIIVLKMRTRVDGGIKCEDAPRYQFAPPNDYGDLGVPGGGGPGTGGPGSGPGGVPVVGGGPMPDQETATTSLMEGMSGGGVRPSAPLLAAAANHAAAAAARGPGPGHGGPGGPGGPGGGPMEPDGVGGVNNNNNGFFGANCALNGDRSRLFRKSNGSKPVREWYV